MSATIVFADGSKRMAHNLDDSRERWELRKEISALEVRNESRAGYDLPVFDDKTSPDEFIRHQTTLINMLAAVKYRKPLVHKKSREYKHLAVVETIIKEQLALAKQIALAKHREEKHAAKMAVVEASNQKTIGELRAYIYRLERALLDAGLPLPNPPYNWMDANQIDAAKLVQESYPHLSWTYCAKLVMDKLQSQSQSD